MKKFTFALLSFFYPIYLIIGGVLVWLAFAFYASAIHIRRWVDYDTLPPYPYFTVIRFWLGLVIFIVVAFLLTRYILKKFQTIPAKWPTKSILFLIPVLCGSILATSAAKYWFESPPMSKERAIKIATEYNDSSVSNVFRSISWDEKGHRWRVEFSDSEGEYCNSVTISRYRISLSGGPCKEVYK